MGLFRKKKKEEEEVGPLPEFPRFPKQKFPTYERELPETKPSPVQEIRVMPPEEKPEEFGIQRRELSMPRLIKEPIISEEKPTERPGLLEEKPLFVKIEKYKGVINTINQIKNKIKEAEKILENLNKIKTQEDRELESWQTDITRIKEKLLSIDRRLFEV